MSLLCPEYLNKGDTILIIGISRARTAAQLAPAISILKSWGLEVETGQYLYEQYHQFAGTDQQRASDLQWAINHPKAKAVLFAGGGYGALRVIDAVDFSSLKRFPKWFIGYSDATVVFSRLNALGICAIHGTMAFQFELDREATESLRLVLFGQKNRFEFSTSPLNRKGITKGELVGGNLSLLYALSCSRDDLDTTDRILFIEDLDEQLYHVDRMMLQLKRSGKLSRLSGLLVGGMTDMKDNAVPYGKSAEEIILDAVKEYGYPVAFAFPAGHIKRNLAIYLGKQAELKVENKLCQLNF